MKKGILFSMCCFLSLFLAGCKSGGGIWSALLIILGVLILALAALRSYNHYQYLQRARKHPKRYKKRPLDTLTMGLYGAALLILLLGLLVSCDAAEKPAEDTTQTTVETTAETTLPPSKFNPGMTTNSDPANWGMNWEIFDSGSAVSSYSRQKDISFGDPETYFSLPGIATFRGNNYRNTSAYGTANVTENTLNISWEAATGTLPGSSWSGSGWTGQPLMAQWDAATRNVMNLYADKKAKDGLVEVIYATLDGNIYFLDLADGTPTRDPIQVGFCFKGSGALDPRGYPILYVGAGDKNPSGEKPRMFVISLIDGSILFEYGHEDPLALRQDNGGWCAFDSSPLVDANTDTLIWPGENGILYTIKLNTSYDETTGSLSVAPDRPVLTRYATARTTEEEYWYGYEASVSIVENYLYVSENGGMFYCVDLNTMALVWAQDTKDDSNASPVFERISEEEGYIYTAPSLHWTKDADHKGTTSIYKLNALTGEIVWEKPYDVHTVDNVSGGVQSTPLLGKPGTSLEGMLICAIARTPNLGTGILVALDTQTGAELWRYTTDFYAWSSPVAVYDDTGKGYIILGDTGSKLHFLEGSTGTVLHTLKLNGNIEATPAVFNDMLVVGTRKEKIYGIQIK